MQCTNVSVTSDGILEDVESHCLTLESSDSVGQSSVTCILVEDSDTVVVEWEQAMYSASEGSNVSICAVQWNASEISFTVDISIPVTANGGKQLIVLLLHYHSHILCLLDINTSRADLTFPPGDTSQLQCVDIDVIQDGILEDEEEHCLTLQTSTSDVIIGAISVTCVVIVNDTVTVNWQMPEYPAVEGDVLPVCAVTLNKSEIAFSVGILLPRGSSEYNILYLLPFFY